MRLLVLVRRVRVLRLLAWVRRLLELLRLLVWVRLE